MGLVVPLLFLGEPCVVSGGRPLIAMIATVTSFGTAGPSCGPGSPRPDRLSPP